jgi:hypothetical protein
MTMSEITNEELNKIMDEFMRKCNRLEEIAKTCRYLKETEYITIPVSWPSCAHPLNRFKVCGHPQDCPILKQEEAKRKGRR